MGMHHVLLTAAAAAAAACGGRVGCGWCVGFEVWWPPYVTKALLLEQKHQKQQLEAHFGPGCADVLPRWWRERDLCHCRRSHSCCHHPYLIPLRARCWRCCCCKRAPSGGGCCFCCGCCRCMCAWSASASPGCGCPAFGCRSSGDEPCQLPPCLHAAAAAAAAPLADPVAAPPAMLPQGAAAAVAAAPAAPALAPAMADQRAPRASDSSPAATPSCCCCRRCRAAPRHCCPRKIDQILRGW
eukprot:1140267-Pelagomonas_calceolata.AAC.7